MKKTLIAFLVTLALLATALPSLAQGFSIQSITSLLKDGVIQVNVPFTINGVTGLVTTNDLGNYVVTVKDATSTLTVTPPTTPAAALQTAEQYVAANNPTNSDYYGTNELVARVGAVYLQNSGQAVVELGVEKYGLIKPAPQIGFGGALFQGHNQGMSATAGAVGFVDYRKIIGDVSAQAGVMGGYDNWNKSWLLGGKFDIEYRQNKHLGEYVGVAYGLEKQQNNSVNSSSGGLMVRGGVNYSF